MNKHTPGPWRVDHKDNGALQIYGQGLIANMAGQSATQPANAALIAAAPELLAALERLAALRLRFHEDAPILKSAHAAIAKVK